MIIKPIKQPTIKRAPLVKGEEHFMFIQFSPALRDEILHFYGMHLFEPPSPYTALELSIIKSTYDKLKSGGDGRKSYSFTRQEVEYLFSEVSNIQNIAKDNVDDEDEDAIKINNQSMTFLKKIAPMIGKPVPRF